MDPRLDLMTNELGARIGKHVFNVALAIQQSSLPRTVQDLVQLRASQINGCAFCVDYHTKDATVAGETATRLHLVAAWREATVFTDAERAALALAEEGTRLADAHHGVSDETWEGVREHFDEDQVVALVALVAMINATNRLNVIVHNPGGSIEPAALAGLAD